MVGIVVVSYRSDDLTIRYVREELSRTAVPYHVVVVENGGERPADTLEQALPGVTVLHSGNKGYAAACNLGALWLREHVRPEAIVFSNNDIRFQSDDVVASIFSALAAHEDAGAAGPCIVGRDGRRQSPEPYRGLWNRYFWMYVSTPFLSGAKKRKVFRLDYAENAGEGFHYKLMGSFLMVRTDDFFRAGCFDERTFLYAEEPILSERLSAIGKGCGYCPSVTLLHDHGAVIRSAYRRKESDLLQFRSMAYYYRRYKGYSAAAVFAVRMFYRLILCFR